ncbi:unnamed protein product [Adineta steineri]|uniref:Small integral membrane protein 15 n=1 Tax=Adineta steineri TaxID=433720 RepID=A0A815F4Q7_9BILA|nr:unnamed protein product [Adineta steineri]CAF1046698.1 unnamed protein product [Adineta steineri]CAF1086602.1 unnamed protein product [Adineta steineri]CAF1137771.1 unnamed protein product [Adineta steineri]CAF1265413.1 unnamed protein product [Adineta steineri]
MVEFKGPGYTSNYNNFAIIIPAIIIVTLIGYFAYRLVDSLMSKKRQKEEKNRLRQKKKEKQTSPQTSPRSKQK